MEGPRAPFSSEYPQVLEFLDTHLRPESEWSIASEYPTALHVNNLHNIRIIKSNNSIVSHAVVKPLIIKTPQTILKAGAIGSVVTDEAARNQGLSQSILKECLRLGQHQSCDFAILWTNLFDFYRKLGFELAGTELSFVFEKEFTASESGLRFLTTSRVSPEAIFKVYSNHTVTTVRTFEDIRKCLNIPNTKVYTAWDSSNQLVAYAIEGKGADLNGYLHEWGGQVSKIISLLSYIRKEKGQPMTLIAPRHSQNLVNELLKIDGVVKTEGFLGMVKILNHEGFFNKIKRAFRHEGVPDFHLSKEGDTFFIGVGSQVFKTHSETDIIRLIFGPQTLQEIYPFEENVRTTLAKVLPLNLWLWGWDSI